jgi:hypothetical protein
LKFTEILITKLGKNTRVMMNSGVQGKNIEYHIVDKVQNSLIDALIFDLIDNVIFVVFALYSRIYENLEPKFQKIPTNSRFAIRKK